MNQQHVQTSKANKTKGKTTWGLDAIVVVGEASDTARWWESAAPQAYCARSVAIVGTKAEVVKHREVGRGRGALRRGPADKAPPPPPVEEMDGGRRRRRIEVGVGGVVRYRQLRRGRRAPSPKPHPPSREGTGAAHDWEKKKEHSTNEKLMKFTNEKLHLCSLILTLT